MKRNPLLATALLAGICLPLSALQINEIRIDDIPGADFNEYAELKGEPNASLDGIWYIVLGDHSGEANFKGSGTVEFAINLTGFTMGADGFFLIGSATATVFDIGLIDYFISTDSFENSDNVTHMLVRNYTGPEVTTIADQLGDLAVDIDDNDDGVPNAVLPWSEIIDAVGVVHNPDEGEWPYGAAFGFVDVGPDPNGNRAPGHVFRYSDTNDWAMGPGDPNSPNALDTPRADNPAAPQEPAVTGFTPIYAKAGASVMVSGTRLGGVTSLTVGDVAANILNRTATTLEFRVPDGVSSGKITVSNSAGSFTSSQSLTVLGVNDQVVFEENFIFAGELGQFSQFSVSGSRVWQYGEFRGKGYVVMNGFGDDAVSDDWLISDPIDLRDATSAGLNIRTAGRFAGPPLEVKASTDYISGAPTSATWDNLEGFVYSMDDDYLVTDSGVLDLTPYVGSSNVRFAIRYTSTGTGSGQTRNWQVHNALVFAEMPTAYEPGVNLWANNDRVNEDWVFAGMGASGLDAEPGFLIADAEWPWVYSLEHGWLFFETAFAPHVYMLDTASDFGWLYTQPGVYPYLYVFALNKWVWYVVDSGSNGGEGRQLVDVGGAAN